MNKEYFQYHYSNLKYRAKKRGMRVNLTLKDLIDQWQKQDGKCYYSGIELQQCKGKKPDQGSLDRVKSHKGYIKGNVVWVCYMAQNAKNEHSEEELIKFCKAVVNEIQS